MPVFSYRRLKHFLIYHSILFFNYLQKVFRYLDRKMISLKGIFITNTTLLLSNRAEGKE